MPVLFMMLFFVEGHLRMGTDVSRLSNSSDPSEQVREEILARLHRRRRAQLPQQVPRQLPLAELGREVLFSLHASGLSESLQLFILLESDGIS